MALRPQDIELHSDEVQDILGTPPKWLIRWGSTVVFLVVGLLLLMSWLVSYPDVVRAKVSITTPVPPAPVVSRQSGKISKLFVSEGDTVAQDEMIGIIENTADENDIFQVENQVAGVQDLNPSSVLDFKPEENLNLGELQIPYSTFTELFEAYKTAVKSNYDVRKIRQIRAQKENISNLNKELKKQQSTLEEEENLAKRAWDRQEQLLADGAAAQQAVDDAESVYLSKKRVRERVKLEVLNNNLQVNELDRKITTIKQSMKLTASSKYVSLSESIKQLQTEIQDWKKKYVLTAPVSGFVSFNPDVKEKMFVDEKIEIATIVPSFDKIIGKAALPMEGSGKVKEGLKVIIKLDGFPFREYGFVRGHVIKKSSIPREGFYDLDVALPEGLRTNRKKTLTFEQQIQGTAEIITDNRSLLSRIFDEITTIFEESAEK